MGQSVELNTWIAVSAVKQLGDIPVFWMLPPPPMLKLHGALGPTAWLCCGKVGALAKVLFPYLRFPHISPEYESRKSKGSQFTCEWSSWHPQHPCSLHSNICALDLGWRPLWRQELLRSVSLVPCESRDLFPPPHLLPGNIPWQGEHQFPPLCPCLHTRGLSLPDCAAGSEIPENVFTLGFELSAHPVCVWLEESLPVKHIALMLRRLRVLLFWCSRKCQWGVREMQMVDLDLISLLDAIIAAVWCILLQGLWEEGVCLWQAQEKGKL